MTARIDAHTTRMPESMRILYLHQYFTTPEFAGGSRSYEMARRFAAQGHEVTLLTSSAFLPESWTAGRDWNVVDEQGIRVLVLPSGYSNRMSFLARVIEFVRYAVKTTLKARVQVADVVFASSTPLTIAVPGVLAARKLGAPFVFEVRDVWPDVPIAIGALRNPVLQRAAKQLERWAYRNARSIVALSEGMAESIASKGVARDRIHVVPNASDLEVFAVPEVRRQEVRDRYEWLGDRRMVLYAGTVGIINGVEYLARLAARMIRVDPEVRFVVVGDGNRADFVRAEASRLGVLDRNFFMLDPVAKKELAAYVAAADLSLSLVADIEALWANSANKFFDTLAAGTAVGVNYGGWQKDAIEKNDAGIVLNVRDIDIAAEDLSRFLNDEDRLALAGANARRLAETEYSRDLLTSRLEKILKDAAGGTSAATG